MSKLYALLALGAIVHAQETSTTPSTLSIDTIQTPTQDTAVQTKSSPGFWQRWSFPVIGPASSAETGFQLNGLLVYSLANPWDEPSRLEISGGYSFKQQTKTMLYADVFSGDWRFQNSIEYRDWPTDYYTPGGSSDGREPDGNYDATSLELYALEEKRLLPGLSLGLGWFANWTEIQWRTNNPFDSVPSHGGIVSGPMFSAQWDQRNHPINPTRGYQFSVETRLHDANFLSDYDFIRTQANARAYHPISERVVLAGALGWEGVRGTVPFYSLPSPDGTKKLRGAAYHELNGQHIWSSQAEVRFPLTTPGTTGIWSRFSAVVFDDFAATGSLLNGLEDKWMNTYGLGLRFLLSVEQQNHLRLDLAMSPHGLVPVIFVRHAF